MGTGTTVGWQITGASGNKLHSTPSANDPTLTPPYGPKPSPAKPLQTLF